MTTKRTHGPCHGTNGGCSYDSMGVMTHTASCQSLYPAQQDPDAITRLARYVRESTMHEVEKEQALSLISEAREGLDREHAATEDAVKHAHRLLEEKRSLEAQLTKAREEQRKATIRAKNDALEKAANRIDGEAVFVENRYSERRNAGGPEEPVTQHVIAALHGAASLVRKLKDHEP